MELNRSLLIERWSLKLDLQGAFLYDYDVGEEIKAYLMDIVKILKYHLIEPKAGAATN